MYRFYPLIKQQLERFIHFSEQEVTVSNTFFSQKTQKVAFFVQEIKQTALLLSQQESDEYADIYAERLFRQFESLENATASLREKTSVKKEKFHSPFRFPPNIHTLSPHKRLIEYRKVLRALNEKISWLVEKNYFASEQEKSSLQEQIAETEYRKQKCLKAIEDLEEKVLFKY